MEDLIKILMEQAGLTEDQARKAVAVMTEYVQDKVPPMLRPTVAKFLAKQKAKDGSGEDDGLF